MNAATTTLPAASPRPAMWPWLLTLLVLAGALNWLNRFVLNTDAVAYLRLAEYYATGRTELMISGYWGPLFSWLAAPWIALGMAPMLAGRLTMVLSAAAFFLAGRRLMRHAGLEDRARAMGSALFLLAAVVWSGQNVTPDLIMAALAVAAVAEMTAKDWTMHRYRPWWCGLFWGLAYLAKPVALPWAGATLLLLAFQRRRREGEPRRTGLALAVTLAVALPWITVLSVKYGRPTFSTSGPIAHALVGPGDVPRYHPPLSTLHRPTEGRVAGWEDPAEFEYRPWSPFASRSNLRHQLRLVTGNAATAFFLLTTISLAWPLVFRRANLESGWPLLVPLGLLAAIYLPVYLAVTEQRYFYAALPLLWAVLAGRQTGRAVVGWRRVALLLCFLLPLLAVAIRFQISERRAGRVAYELAQVIRMEGKSGPVAGSGLLPGGRTGLYLALFLGEPWHGDDPEATAGEFVNSGARWLVFKASDPRLAELESLANLERLSPEVLPEPDLAVFHVR